MDNYAQSLPDDYYYPSLSIQILSLLYKGENVLVGGVYGCGIHTFINVFASKVEHKPEFDHVYYFSSSSQLLRQVSQVKNQSGKKLVVVYAFEQVKSKNTYLEKLHQLRQPNASDLAYLIIGDHTVVTSSHQYLGVSTPFFNQRFVITPFDLNQTNSMIKINDTFFGWKTPLSLYSRIFELSGGIQRLTKHICKLVSDRQISLEKLDGLLLNPSILFQLQLLTKIISQGSKHHLLTLGITNSSGQIRSKLLQIYLETNFDAAVLQYFPSLTSLEGKLFALLHQNSSRVVTLDQIGDVFELLGCEFSPWAIYKLISRLKPKITPQYKINSLKGRGYLLSTLP